MDISQIYICIKWEVKAKIKMKRSKNIRHLTLPILGDLNIYDHYALEKICKKKGTLIEVTDQKPTALAFAFYRDNTQTLDSEEKAQLWAYIKNQNLIPNHGSAS